MTLPNFSTEGYQVTKELGRNYQGGRITYKAQSINSNQLVVIKEFCFAQKGTDWAGYKAHEREIQVLQRLKHPRIPRYLDTFETESGFCLVQEYKQAISLPDKGQLNPEEIKKIAISVLEILEYLQGLHPPIFHRDIKPENILIDEDLNAYLVDFGCARIETGDRGVSSFVAGTLGFMPHEQTNNLDLTKASDLYSLGATLICLLTKTRSQDIGQLISVKRGFDFKDKVPPLHRDFITWLEKMVDPEINKRYRDAKTALLRLKSIRVEGLSLSEKVGSGLKNTGGFLFKKSVIIPLIIVIGGSWGIKYFRDIQHQQMIAQEQARIQQKREQEQARIKTEQLTNNVQKIKLINQCVQCDLQGVNFSYRNLQSVNLQGANLINADLRSADLSGANFTNANLKGANLDGVDGFGKANFTNATMPDGQKYEEWKK